MRGRSALPGRFLSRRCFTLCITMEAEIRTAKQYKCQYCCSCNNYRGKGMEGYTVISRKMMHYVWQRRELCYCFIHCQGQSYQRVHVHANQKQLSKRKQSRSSESNRGRPLTSVINAFTAGPNWLMRPLDTLKIEYIIFDKSRPNSR